MGYLYSNECFLKDIEKYNYNRKNWDIYNINDKIYFDYKNSTIDIAIKKDNLKYIKQILENEFLLYYFIGSIIEKKYELIRISIEGNTVEKKYTKTFNNCYLLSDDVILFDKKISSSGSIRKYTVYSIKENKELEELSWLSNDCYLSIIDKSENNDKSDIIIEVTKVIKSSYGFEDDYVKFFIDTKKFNLIDKVYSTLRDKYIIVKDKDEVINIINEDIKYKKIIDLELDNDKDKKLNGWKMVKSNK